MSYCRLYQKLLNDTLNITTPPKKWPIIPWVTKNQNSDAQIYTPKAFQRAWLLAMESPYIEKLVLCKSARVGYAIFINTSVAWQIANDPASIMIVQNTEGDANKFANREINKVFTYCPAVSERLIGKKTATEKMFYGGDLSVVWATSASSFRLVTIKYLFLDEISGWPDNTDKEGDPVELAITRTESEGQRKIVMGSTPKEAGTCKITREFLLTDQRYLYVPCPHCQTKQRLKIANLRYQDGDFKNAHFVCEHCSKEIHEHHKFEMVSKGEWRATREFSCCDLYQEPSKWDETGTAICCKCNKPGDTNERGKVDAGFHIWSAYNDNPNTALASIAKEYDVAKNDPLKMQTFMNTKVGVEYSDTQRAHKLNNFDALYERREHYEPFTVLPKETRCLLASVDTQKNRFEYHIYVVGEQREFWAVEYGTVLGDPEELQTQQALIDKLSQTFRLHDGRELSVYAVVMDCNGHAWKAMLEFCAPYNGWIYAIRGDAQLQNKFKPELTLNFKHHNEALCDFRTINVHQLKNQAAERLNNIKPGKNYLHFPVADCFGINYFQMLTAEELIGSGNKVKWALKKGQKRNEPWDLFGYLLWLYDFLRPEINFASPNDPLGLTGDDNNNQVSDDYQEYSDNYETSEYEAYY